MKKYLIFLIPITLVLLLITPSNNKDYIEYADDVYLAVLVNGEEQSDLPEKGYLRVSVLCTNSIGRWNYDDWKLEIHDINGPVKCSLDFNDVSFMSFSDYIISLNNTEQGNGMLINENGYRYQGKNPNNYVLFNKEYWRIIGVFNESPDGSGKDLVKLARNESIGYLMWDFNYTGGWDTGGLNALLNDYYYLGLNGKASSNCLTSDYGLRGRCDFEFTGIVNSEYRSMIYRNPWRINPIGINLPTVSDLYAKENSSTEIITHERYVGLMYPSDYGYSVLASSCPRNTPIPQYNILNCAPESWMLSNYTRMSFISVGDIDNYSIHEINDDGAFGLGYSYGLSNIVPSIYLKEDVIQVAGDGSYLNPYIIARPS